MTSKVCRFCKKDFNPIYSRQHFCSQYCAQQSIFKKAFFTDENPKYASGKGEK